MTNLRIKKLNRTHAVEEFTCGRPELDRFLVRHALRNQQANSSQTYVGLSDTTIIRFYTIVAGEVRHVDAPERVVIRYATLSHSASGTRATCRINLEKLLAGYPFEPIEKAALGVAGCCIHFLLVDGTVSIIVFVQVFLDRRKERRLHEHERIGKENVLAILIGSYNPRPKDGAFILYHDIDLFNHPCYRKDPPCHYLSKVDLFLCNGRNLVEGLIALREISDEPDDLVPFVKVAVDWRSCKNINKSVSYGPAVWRQGDIEA